MRHTDSRGVSPVLGYVLTLSIATLLVGGLLVASSGFVTDQREQTAEGQLQVIGQQVSGTIAAADRLNRTDGASEVAVGQSLPQQVVGSAYGMSVVHDGDGPTRPYLELQATELDVTVTVGIAVESDVNGSAGGGPISVEYDSTQGELVLQNA